MTTKVFGVQQKSTGKWLHVIRYSRRSGELLTAENWHDAWVAFEADAVAQASELEPAGDWIAVEITDFCFETLQAYSDEKIDWKIAMRDSLAGRFTTLFFWVENFGLHQPPLPPEIVDRITEQILEPLCGLIVERFNFTRSAVLCRNIEIYVAEVTENEVSISNFASPDPGLVAQYLIDSRMFIGSVTDEMGECEIVKAELQKHWYQTFREGICIGLDSKQ